MPIKKCENGKYRIGDGPCKYKTKEDAEKAQRAYYASKEEQGDKMNKSIKDVEDNELIEVKILKGMKDLLKEYFGYKKTEIPVIKQFNEEEQIAIEPMYCGPMQVDGHGEYMTEETIRGMVDSANDAIEKGKLSGGVFHKENLDEIEILKAWVNECDCIIGDTEVPEGQPIVKVKFHDTDLWNLRKEGKLRGLSIGGKRKPLEKDNE